MNSNKPAQRSPSTLGIHRNTALAACIAALPLAGLAAPPEPDHAKGRVLIQTRAGLPDAELASLLKPHGGKAQRIGATDLFIVSLPPNASERAVQAQLAHHPHLKFAELDQRVALGYASNDPYAGSQWHLSRIRAQSAWDVSQGQGVTVAILDTGVSASHPDLAANLVPGWNFYGNNADTSDPHGHGTAVAGAAAAVTNNATGVAGVAGSARIMPVRIADANAYAYWSTVAQGLTWAADNGARVANISYVGVAGSSTVQSAAQYMKNLGGLVIVCAGNNGVDEGIAPTATMIPVSATNSSDVKTSWSSWGNFVALSAPGQDIWTTSRSGGYEAWWGTSLASPVVAGAVAAMMGARPDLSASQVESLLFATAVDLGAAGRDPVYGYGRVDVAAAVQAALNTTATDTQAPSVSITSPGAGTVLSGLVSVNASAADNVGVTQVELFVNGTLLATDTTSPYQFSWDTTKTANGSVSLVAKAYDAAGNVKNTSISVSVSNAVVTTPDTTPPSLSITNPIAGTKVGTSLTVTTVASDNAGAAGIQQSLYIDGKLVASATGSKLSYKWSTRKVSAGTHTISAVARDAAGNSTTAQVSVLR